jgi:hypothetical protein
MLITTEEPGSRIFATNEDLGRRIFFRSFPRLKIKIMVARKNMARTMKND